MRTTVNLDPDVAAAIDKHRDRSKQGVSETVNRLIRQGLAAPTEGRTFVQRTRPLGLRIDVRNVAEALELLEGPAAR